MPEVISNTSPLQYLYQLGLINLLFKMYGKIIIPDAVVRELDDGRLKLDNQVFQFGSLKFKLLCTLMMVTEQDCPNLCPPYVFSTETFGIICLGISEQIIYRFFLIIDI